MNIKNSGLIMLDMDGTLYLGDNAISGAAAAVNKLRAGYRLCFLTNNSSKSRNEYYNKLNRLGFNPSMDEIYTSGLAAIRYVKMHYPNKSVYLMGTRALKNEFEQAGITLTETNPDIVITGYDTESVYEKLSKTCIYIREGRPYISTHPDINCPAPGGYLPDAGAFAELIKASTGRYPDVICGKPYGVMAEAVANNYNVQLSGLVMVGDRITTDIKFASDNGFESVLVLSGETDRDMLSKSGACPGIVLNSIEDIINYI